MELWLEVNVQFVYICPCTAVSYKEYTNSEHSEVKLL
jgi:hypothetical protein